MKFFGKCFSLIILLVVVFVVYVVISSRSSAVNIDLYGTSTDEATIQLEGVLSDIKQKFDDKVNINFHYVAVKSDDGGFASYQADRADGRQTTKALQDFDIEENQRRLVIQKAYPDRFLDYLKIKNDNYLDINWQFYAQYAGLKEDKIRSKVEKTGRELLTNEIDQFTNVHESLGYDFKLLPFLFFNNKIYYGPVDMISLSGQVAKEILRKGRESLPPRKEISLFGEKIKISPFGSYLIYGVAECYNDFHCNDKKDLDGACVDIGTKAARCVYTEPSLVNLMILGPKDYQIEQDFVAANLQEDFKKINIVSLDVNMDEGRRMKKALEIKDEDLPAYFFDLSIGVSKNFPFYQQAGLIQPIDKDGYKGYLFSILETETK